MVIDAKISRRSPLEYALASDGARIGWLRPGVLTLCGYARAEDARRAAMVAVDTLCDWYRRRWHVRVPLAWSGDEPSDLRLETNGVVVGRLLPVCRPTDGGPESHGFELAVPRELWIATAVELVQRIHSALHAVELTARQVTSAERSPATLV
jgi:hypothetical protein